MIAKFEKFEDVIDYLELSFEHFRSIEVESELFFEEYAFNLKMKAKLQVSKKSLGLYLSPLKGSVYPTMFAMELDEFDYFQVIKEPKKIQISFNWGENYIAIEF